MTVGFQSGEFQFETYGEPISSSGFMEFVFRISGIINFEILVEDLDTGGTSSITVS